LVWTLFHAKLHRTLGQRQLLPRGERLLVAVSGGQDSLCLIRLLLDLQPHWHWQLAVAHCDHRWRSDSQANAKHVAHLARAWQLPYFEKTAAEIPKTEAQARHWRYQVLGQLAQDQGYFRLLTGHTASDRAETLLYNLIRGSGADGLQALTWQRPLARGVELVRPLLEFTRAETAEFCRTYSLPVWEDATNQDWAYARNRIRQELLPYLHHFNPQVETTLAQTAELLRAEVIYLEEQATFLLQAAQSGESSRLDGAASRLDRSVLQSVPLALQRRVIRQFLQAHLGSAPSFEHIEKVVALITAPNRSQTDPLPGSWTANVNGPWIELHRT